MLPLLALAGACATFVSDPAPPTNVRSSPNGAIVTTLGNGTKLTVESDRGGWLRISSPAAGYVHVSVTVVRCGDESAIHDLSLQALSDAGAADTLVRFAIGADGVRAEDATSGIGRVMRASPGLLIDVLDQFSDAERRDVLRDTMGWNDDKRAVQAFDAAVKAHPDSATAATWRAMVRACRGPIASLLPC